MDITNDMIVTVYRFGGAEYLKSAHSNFEVLIEDQPLVAYSEDLKYLYQLYDPYHYSTARYFNDTMHCETEEMTYLAYTQKYKAILDKQHADAPVLNLNMEDDSTELPTNPYERLVKLGVRFS